MSTGGYAGSGGSSEGCPSSGKAPATRLSRLTGGVPLPFAAPANLHISRNAARARLLGGTGRLPAQPSAGTPPFPSLSRIAGHPLPPPASSPLHVPTFMAGDSPPYPRLSFRETVPSGISAPLPVQPLIGVRKPHHDWLPCAPGTASPQPPLSSSPRCPTVPFPARPGARSGRPCPYASPSTAAPFRAFPPNRAVIPSYRLLLIFFRMVGKWIPIHNAVFGIHTAVLISYMEFYLDLILYIWNALFTARS